MLMYVKIVLALVGKFSHLWTYFFFFLAVCKEIHAFSRFRSKPNRRIGSPNTLTLIYEVFLVCRVPYWA